MVCAGFPLASVAPVENCESDCTCRICREGTQLDLLIPQATYVILSVYGKMIPQNLS